MKRLKGITLALAVTALTALAGTPSASATTLEIGGVAQNRAVTTLATVRAGNELLIKDTSGFSLNTCSESTIHAETERTFTTAGTGEISGAVRTFSFSRCTTERVVVHRAGRLSVKLVSGTTNGTVFSSGAEITTPTSLGTLTCTTNNTDIGTLTGVRTGQATFTIRAGLTCTGIGTGNWTGTYTVTSPEGLGVTSDAAPTTTFEVGGVRKNEEVGIAATLRAGNTAILKDTLGFTQNTCSGSTAEGHTESPFTGATVGGPVTSLSFSSCTTEGVVVHRAGTLSVQWIRGTTNGTVFSSGAEVTVPVPGGSIITCTTNNTDIGTLTGVRTGQATFTIRAGLTCTGIGTGNWTGTYTVTSPEGLGVTE